MKRVFLDTNILLDFGLDRKGAEEAEKILALGLTGAIEVCASYLSYANMGFILRHHSKEENTKGEKPVPVPQGEPVPQGRVSLVANRSCPTLSHVSHRPGGGTRGTVGHLDNGTNIV